ncbi:MAG: aminotransferase class I/II-fold pyridoxal phosphate-dependent enzyme, partial [Candidatus Thorarchaeota archaeon]
TGGVLKKDTLKLIYDLSVDHDFVIFSDEIYSSLVYDGFTQNSMLEIDPALERSMIINGLSKAYSMTGWRLGYAVANEETIDNMVRIQQNTTSCATSFVQAAGVEALNGDQSFIAMVKKEYQKRRDRITQLFKEMAQIPCIDPKGAFYVFPDFSEFGLSSNTLAELLLKKTGVVSTPGNVFGEHYDNNLRFSYATSLDVIEEGLMKLTEFLPTL